MLQMHKLSYYSVISFFLFCRDCPNAPFSPEEMEIGATLRRDHGTPPVKSWGEQLAADGEKKLHSSTPSPLSRGYKYLNKWKLIHDYQEKQHESLGALESIRNWWYQVKIDRMKIFYLLTLTFRYWQRHIVLALKCLPPIFFNNQARCLLHLPLLSHNLKREYVG